MDALFTARSWADVVRESQEIVELALEGLLRAYGVDPPRIHDVADVLTAERPRLPAPLHGDVPRLAEISRGLRRDRELAFDGAEDLTPSDTAHDSLSTRCAHTFAERTHQGQTRPQSRRIGGASRRAVRGEQV